MKPTTVAFWLTVCLTALAIIPAIYVLAREVARRGLTRRALRRIEAAQQILRDAPESELKQVSVALRAKFDVLTIERALVALLRNEDPGRVRFAARLFEQFDLVARYGERLRKARAWSERTHAAEVLGLVQSPLAVGALVAALRDPYEDAASVKIAAANALARLKDPAVVPLLVKELEDVDERSSPAVAEALVTFGALAVAELMGLLEKQESRPARVWAARILGRIGDPQATDALILRLHDRQDLLRVAIAEALGAIGDKRALQPLIQATLRDPAAQVRAHAAGAVAKIEGAGAVDVLVAALADPDYATRIRVLEAFENIKLDDTKVLEGALHDPNLEVRRRAALALERVGYLDKLIAALAEGHPKASARAYGQMLELGRAGLADSVAAYLHHESFQVRARVALACGELGITRIGPLLVPAVDDPEWPVRAALAEAIGRLRADGGAPALAKLLVDPEEPVREAAAQALPAYPLADIEPFADAILEAYDKGNVPVRLQMVVLASRIDRPEMATLLTFASADPSEAVRLRAVDSLGGRPEEIAVQPLIARLTDPSLDVRMAAVAALGTAASVEAFEGLLRALPGAPPAARDRIADSLARGGRRHLFDRIEDLVASSDVDVKIGIAWTLGKIADPIGVPYLSQFLRDRDAPLRASAAGALAKIPGEASLRVLIGACADRDSRTRAAVVNALGKIAGGDPRAFDALRERLRDPDPFVRNRAVVALARVGDPRVMAEIEAHAQTLDEVAVTVALALLGTEEALGQAMEKLANPACLEAVQAFLAHEGDVVRAEFFSRLELDDGTALEKHLDLDAIVLHYEGILRTSLDVKSRRTAVEGLARVKVPRVIEILADALIGDPSEDVRLRAAQGLATMMNEPVARTALVRAVADPIQEVALVAVRALRTTRDRAAQGALFARLGLGTDVMNEAVEDALATMHAHDVLSFADRMMGLDVAETTIASVRVLERIGSPDALPLLREIGRSEDPRIRVASVRAMAKLPGVEAALAVDAVVDDPHESVRLAVLEAVCAAHDPSSILRVTRMRGDPSVAVRARFAEVLAGFSGVAPAKVLTALAEDASSNVRASALATMLAIGDDENLRRFSVAWSKVSFDTRRQLTSEPRREAITDRLALLVGMTPDAKTRETAVVGIGALGAPGYGPKLYSALLDPASAVRIAAIRALAPLRDEAVRARIAELSSDPDEEVRDVARRSALRTVG